MRLKEETQITFALNCPCCWKPLLFPLDSLRQASELWKYVSAAGMDASVQYSTCLEGLELVFVIFALFPNFTSMWHEEAYLSRWLWGELQQSRDVFTMGLAIYLAASFTHSSPLQVKSSCGELGLAGEEEKIPLDMQLHAEDASDPPFSPSRPTYFTCLFSKPSKSFFPGCRSHGASDAIKQDQPCPLLLAYVGWKELRNSSMS